MIQEGAVCCEGREIDQVKRDNKVRFSWLHTHPSLGPVLSRGELTGAGV